MKRSIIAVSIAGLMYGMCAAGDPAETKAQTGQAAARMEQTDVPAPATGGEAPAAETTQAPREVTMESDADKVNYSLGYELGQDLKREDLELAPDVLIRGAEDAISGAKPLMRPTQRRAALAQIKEKRAQAHLEKSQAFLAANAEKDGVQSLPSGLQYKEIKVGGGKTPGPNDRVTVNYRGTLIDGTQFDSSYDRGKPSTFPVKKVIKGWAEALQLMKEGATWELYIPPDLAYGKLGRKNRIPPNSALIFEVELISVN